MRLVPQAAMRPHRCAVIPFKGNSSSRGFIDTGMDLPGWDPHVYVSVEAVEQMARLCGFEPRFVAVRQAEKVAARDKRIAELEAELAEHVKFREAAEYTLAQFGAKVKNKPGRKPERAAA